MPALLDMNPLPAQSDDVDDRPKAAMRFTYPSGSRPLEGYTIKRGVGRGGFGEVYFAVSDAGKEVALKLIRRNLEVELRGVTQCLNLKHANLIDLYDIRTDENDDRWVVMEYVSGDSLEDLIGRRPQGMPLEEALRLFDGICAGVAYLHDHGIVHRDLKPANIFIDEGVIKIGDYGLSKFISCSRRSGQTESVGTVHYMAPEIANGRYGREIDAYALGIILYEMITGHVPFEGESVGEVLMKHLTAEPDLSALAEPFRSVVQSAMAKDPERRINNAAQMAAMLRGVAPAAISDVGAVYSPGGGATSSSNNPAGAPAALFGHAAQANGSRPPFQSAFVEFFHRRPEPVWSGLIRGWHAMGDDLRFDQWSTFHRFAAAALLTLLAVFFSPLWLALLGVFAASYVLYRVFRVGVQICTVAPASMATELTPAPSATSVPEPSAAGISALQPLRPITGAATTLSRQRPWRRRVAPSWRQAAHAQLGARTARERASALFGSLLAASIIAPVAALLVCVLTQESVSGEFFLWSAIVATMGSWAVIVPAQLTEGRLEDHAPLRFVQLLLGVLLGLAAYGLASSMYLKLPVNDDVIFPPTHSAFTSIFNDRVRNIVWQTEGMTSQWREGAISLPPSMYAAYFGFLFVLPRWWRLAEWTRSSHVSLWAVVWSGFLGFFVSMFWWFPQPLGLLLAGAIAFTVQLSSPWLSPSRRKALAHAAV